MGVSILTLALLVMKCTIQVKARLNIILLVSYDAMPYMAAVAVYGLTKYHPIYKWVAYRRVAS